MTRASTRFIVPHTLAALASHTGATLRGNPDLKLNGVATLKQAGPQDVAFMANAVYATQLQTTQAGAVIVGPDYAAAYKGPALIHDHPYVVFAKVAGLCVPASATQGTVDPSAHIAATAKIDPSAVIGPGVVIGERTTVGARTLIDANTVVGDDVEVGEDCVLYPHVTVYCGVSLGSRVKVHAGSVIGSDGFGYAFNQDHWIAVPQLGSVQVHDDVEIGAQTTIDRGAVGDTIIERGVKIDNHVQIAHNVVIGAHTVIAGTAAFSGSAKIGRFCVIGGGATFAGHITVCDGVQIAGMTTVTRSIDMPGTYASGTGMLPVAQWRKSVVHFRHLNDIVKRIKVLEQTMEQEKSK